MSFTNHTPNYNLPQYVGTDKPTFLGDFNNAMTTIDTALHNNEQNAGKGLSELQQAQAALTETQETLTEVQTEVANVSGIAATVNQNVQQALTAANDATTAANSATSQIQPAVTAANQASADAQAAQQVANGNVTTLNGLSERVSTLEQEAIKEFTTKFQGGSFGGTGMPANILSIQITEQTKKIVISNLNTNGSYKWTAHGVSPTKDATFPVADGDIDETYLDSTKYSSISTIVNGTGTNYLSIDAAITFGKKNS